MRFKKGLIFSVFLLLIPIIAETEVIDNRDSRREYARSVSQLGMLDYSVSSEPRLRKKGQSPITLVLFRSSEGIPEFGEYAPRTLVFGPHGCSAAAYADKEAAMEAIEYLRSLPGIIYAELDGEVYANDSAIDSTDGKQEATGLQHSFHSYGASEMGFEQAVTWCRETGMDSLTVAVIDSGVYPHPFLKDRLEISGFDYVDGDEDSTNDIFGHGTHVAGIVVDCTPELPVFICPIRILDSNGKGSIANTTSAIFEAAESGCAVINLSLTAKQHSEALEDAVKFALNHGSSVVIAAGNNGDDSKGYCPVHLEDDGLIVVGSCVGSINVPVRASYSNYGSCVDVFAFGTLIQSCALSGKYMTMTGTSVTNRIISDRYGVFNQNGGSSGGFGFYYFYAIASPVDCPYLDNYYCCSRNQPSYNCASLVNDSGVVNQDHKYISTSGLESNRFFRYDYYRSYYTDYQKVYKFKRYLVRYRQK